MTRAKFPYLVSTTTTTIGEKEIDGCFFLNQCARVGVCVTRKKKPAPVRRRRLVPLGLSVDGRLRARLPGLKTPELFLGR